MHPQMSLYPYFASFLFLLVCNPSYEALSIDDPDAGAASNAGIVLKAPFFQLVSYARTEGRCCPPCPSDIATAILSVC
ncbi:protein of unknown function (plasmid) [Cupriavidus taiwanensis]|uniref:Uncharacterized protein n=1 Tax=Cupriavidus taiwanensis TaxID=164546 RepID=A0A375FGR0_9BURK|nr:protein of unknown function [Cupriavidus taiwanensis]SOZ72137.1 protein of unknown function [Cupriavidus taiwanensis]SOZ74434.1 protein of unknown function [Cupriavidus taiwanensis]SPA03415.1 protein of unknown function [Cupriavidus taiwanensis]SPA11356.1 protein of unknown function [Cupriavidus taiwanensis]